VIETNAVPPARLEVQSSYFACVRGRRRPVHLLTTGPHESLSEIGDLHLSGETLTLTFVPNGTRSFAQTGVLQIDVMSGRRVFEQR